MSLVTVTRSGIESWPPAPGVDALTTMPVPTQVLEHAAFDVSAYNQQLVHLQLL